jgi:hypothetical protein
MKIKWDKEYPGLGFTLVSETPEENELLAEWFDDHVDADSLRAFPSDSQSYRDCEKVELEFN